MPLECVAIRKAAQNQTLSGRCARCITVPAVTEVSLPQVAQAKVRTGRQASRLAFELPQPGQRKPAGHREMLGACRIVRKTLLELAQRTRKAGHERTLRGYMFMIRSYHAAGPKTTTRCAAGLNGMSLWFRAAMHPRRCGCSRRQQATALVAKGVRS